jgi:hypothetical protein
MKTLDNVDLFWPLEKKTEENSMMILIWIESAPKTIPTGKTITFKHLSACIGYRTFGNVTACCLHRDILIAVEVDAAGSVPHPEELHLQLLIPRRLLRPIRRLVSAATAALAATRRSTAAAGSAVAAAIRSIVLAGFRLLPAVVGRQGSVTARAVVPATATAAKIRYTSCKITA